MLHQEMKAYNQLFYDKFLFYYYNALVINYSKTDKQKETAEKNIKVVETKIMEAELNISTITSKSNYSDPRIIVQWAKKTETPIEQLYNKSQLTKFGWSMDTKSNWEF